jgi:peptide-methionine (S)-S-oxide reductase
VNIAEVASVILRAAQRNCADSLKEQLDYAVSLVAWSWIARQCAVQIHLLDVLLDGGASADGAPENALVNGNIEAAKHLVERGARLSLATAVCLELWKDATGLAAASAPRERQFALTLAAVRGNAPAIRFLVGIGIDVNAVSSDLYSHATPLHHAVSSGSLQAVQVLVDAGADLNARDTAHQGTPLGWAEYSSGKKAFQDIAAYLREVERSH